MSGKRAIVTGSTGFIGRALCRELLEYGYEVFAVVRPGSERKQQLEEFQEQKLTVIEAELHELSRLGAKDIQADVCYHLAWNGSSGAERSQFETQYSNIRYTAEAIRMAKHCGCRRFIGAGSQAEYGIVHGKAKEYETVPHPFMMYGAAKLSAYHMGKIVAQQEGITFVWPRIYSVYGPGENLDTLVSYLIDTLKKGQVPQVTDCENMWDFTYIGDCVGMLRVLGESDECQGVYNLSAGKPQKLREFVEEIRDVVAPGAEIAFGAKKAELERTFWLEPDVSNSRILGYECNTSFSEGIRRKMEEK